MPLGGKLRPGGPLAVALAAGLVVRVARLLRDPLMHPDGPAYLELARAAAREGPGGARRVLLAALSRRRGRARGDRAPPRAGGARDRAARRPRRATARPC